VIGPSPPRRAEQLLNRLLPGDARGESILGDLAEKFARMARSRSERGARLWYWGEVLRLGSRHLLSRRPKKMRGKGDSMSTFARDLKLAVRSLAGAKGYTAIIVVTLALGIGANTAVFSMVDALVLRPFPIPDIERLVMLWERVPKLEEDRGAVSPANFLDWKAQTTVFEDLVADEWWDVNIRRSSQNP
jgi:putative ABC transport system permease protein